MVSVADLATTLQPLLTTVADQAARESSFIRRVRTLTGAAFVQTLVFGWLGTPDASLSLLTQTATACDAPLTRQGLDQRFTPQAADCLRRVLATAMAWVVAADAVALPILAHFCDAYLWDSTTITLPDALAALARLWRAGRDAHMCRPQSPAALGVHDQCLRLADPHRRAHE